MLVTHAQSGNRSCLARGYASAPLRAGHRAFSEFTVIPSVARTIMDIRYAAGFFDGEGCIRVDRCVIKARNYTRYQLKISVGQANPDVLVQFKERFGGAISIDRYAAETRANTRTRYQWYSWSRHAYDFLVSVQPYLIVKADEAALAIEFYRRMKETDRMNRHLSKQEREQIRATRDADLVQLSAMKRREFHIEPSTVALTSAS